MVSCSAAEVRRHFELQSPQDVAQCCPAFCDARHDSHLQLEIFFFFLKNQVSGFETTQHCIQ